MAYNFTATSSQYLITALTPITSAPFTMSAFGSVSTGGATRTLISIESGNSNILYQLYVNTSLRLGLFSRGSSQSDFTSSTVTINTMFHGAAVFNSINNRTLYFNGSNPVNNTINIGSTPVNRINIGSRYYSGSLGGYQDGTISEVGIWSAALTADEIASLAKGMTCDKVRPQSLVFYAPLVRDLIDQKGGLTITNNNGATVAQHPRVYA
jgi:hypothetical protein